MICVPKKLKLNPLSYLSTRKSTSIPSLFLWADFVIIKHLTEVSLYSSQRKIIINMTACVHNIMVYSLDLKEFFSRAHTLLNLMICLTLVLCTQTVKQHDMQWGISFISSPFQESQSSFSHWPTSCSWEDGLLSILLPPSWHLIILSWAWHLFCMHLLSVIKNIT